jgi:predicted transcriptional regulator
MTYTEIDKKFRRVEMKIGSSEIYKHLDILLEFRFIAKKRKLYIITLKGKKLVEGLQEWSTVPPTIPKIEMIF